MNAPLVSVVIPCHNGETYIAEAISSALSQSYSPIEVIVIDDGSTDRSLAIIRSFGKRIKWATGRNRGGAEARNRGLKITSGELIQFLDADDILHRTKIERQVAVALAKQPAIVYCDYRRIEMATGREIAVHSYECEDKDPVDFILRTVLLSTSAPLHWKSQLEMIGGFRADLRASQEFDLHLRLAAAGATFWHLPEILYSVRVRDNSVSSDYVKTVAEQLKSLPQIASKLEKSNNLSEERRRAFAARLAWNGRACMQRRSSNIGLEFFEAAKKIHPRGGVDDAYSAPTRLLFRVLGPIVTERIVKFKRGVLGQLPTLRDGRDDGPCC